MFFFWFCLTIYHKLKVIHLFNDIEHRTVVTFSSFLKIIAHCTVQWDLSRNTLKKNGLVSAVPFIYGFVPHLIKSHFGKSLNSYMIYVCGCVCLGKQIDRLQLCGIGALTRATSYSYSSALFSTLFLCQFLCRPLFYAMKSSVMTYLRLHTVFLENCLEYKALKETTVQKKTQQNRESLTNRSTQKKTTILFTVKWIAKFTNKLFLMHKQFMYKIWFIFMERTFLYHSRLPFLWFAPVSIVDWTRKIK